MKKFVNKTVSISKTQMIDKLIYMDDLEKMRVAVYPNEGKEGGPVVEIDFHFTKPQAIWDNVTELKLRNGFYKLNNIAYQVPADFQDAQPFYNLAIKRSREFKKYTNSDLHCKLGKRYPDRYYTVPYNYVSYDPNTKTGILQITEPVLKADGTFNWEENYQCIDFEMNYAGNNLDYTWLSEE